MYLGCQKGQFKSYLTQTRDAYICIAWEACGDMDEFIGLIKSLPRVQTANSKCIAYLKLAENMNAGMPKSKSQLYQIVEPEKVEEDEQCLAI